MQNLIIYMITGHCTNTERWPILPENQILILYNACTIKRDSENTEANTEEQDQLTAEIYL